MDSPLPPDPYKALDVSKDASLATIRTAHRKLVLKTHPDKVQGDEELKKTRAGEFHQIQQAYEILSDDNRRKAYDDQVKLATLRAEMMAERGGSRNLSDARPMSGRSPIIEVRGGRIYEERAPRRSYDDSGDDFFSSKLRDSRPKYDEYFNPPSSRKSSIRLQEEKISRARSMEEERERLDRVERLERDRMRADRINAKAGKKSEYAERTRQRDQIRRQDYDIKYRHTHVEDGSNDSSDSSDTQAPYTRRREEPPRPRYEEIRRTDREETPRRTSKREVMEYPDLDSKINNATNYIRKASREPEVEARRPAIHKGYSTREIRPATSPPPPREEYPRRVSARTAVRRESPPPKSSAKKGRVTEIVDPPAEFRSRPSVPSMPVSSSDPKGLRTPASLAGKGKASRASTYDQTPERKSPGIRRADTMPNRPRHDEKPASKSSRSKEYDSFSSSDSPPRPSHKSKPKINNPIDEEDEEPSRDYRTVNRAPKETPYRRERNVSPSTRPPAKLSRGASSARVHPARTVPYAAEDEFRPQRLKRAETSYASPVSSGRPLGNTQSPRAPLFAEMQQTQEPYRIVNENKRATTADISFSSHGGRHERRGSDEGHHRDWVPGSEFDSRNRAGYSRSTSRVQVN
ncbi:MAG: hypothetical protein Q9212_007157 [Teloschistes hypoglaucus]